MDKEQILSKVINGKRNINKLSSVLAFKYALIDKDITVEEYEFYFKNNG